MPRRASMDVDLGIGVRTPDRWTAPWVQVRVQEAFAIERRLPIAHRRASIATAWPKINHEFADVVGWPDARERVLEDWSRTRGGVFAAEISRMDQAHDWLRVYLAQYEVERLCLSQWAAAAAYHRSLRRLLIRKGWSRSTFYRRVTAGAHIIAVALDANGEPVT